MKRFVSNFWVIALVLSPLFMLSVQGGQRTTVPAGTEVQVRLADQLDTGEAQAGQTFSATVAQPVVVNGRTIFAQGAKVNGRVIEAVGSGRLKRPASITLELTSLRTEPLRIDGKSHLLRNVGLMGGGAAAGAIIGGVTGGKKGAAIGAAVGAGAGTATAYMTGKKEIVIPVETALTFVAAGAAVGKTAAATASRGEQEAERPSGESSAFARRGSSIRPSGATAASSEAPEGGRGGALREAAQALMFSERDQQLVRRHYTAQTANLPPGLAKRGGRLPPGLERHLQRNGTLPPGLQKRIEPFPQELSQQLPKLPTGYSRVIVAGRALILDRNHKILDLMSIIQ